MPCRAAKDSRVRCFIKEDLEHSAIEGLEKLKNSGLKGFFPNMEDLPLLSQGHLHELVPK